MLNDLMRQWAERRSPAEWDGAVLVQPGICYPAHFPDEEERRI